MAKTDPGMLKIAVYVIGIAVIAVIVLFIMGAPGK
jgi:hypothetical protein